jgi:NADH dehydrogenase FAD-containing subunit
LEKEAIKRAKSVLVVGGGAIGVEVMGELVSQFMSHDEKTNMVLETKYLAIVTKSDTLLPYHVPKAQKAAVDFMEKFGVKLFFETDYDEKFKEEHKFEHVILC